MGPPIFIGGRFEWGLPGQIQEVGFNGAADFHRRKEWGNLEVGLVENLASMGPPIFIGGRVGSFSPMIASNTLLQWGRRFSSAEGHSRLLYAPCRAPLQWGRRFSSAEGPAADLPYGDSWWLQWGRRFFIGGRPLFPRRTD